MTRDSRIIYSVMSSLDGYLTDADGDFSWAVPSEEVVASLTADLANVSTYLYGRRMYETMRGWETDPSYAEGSPASAEFATVWTAAEKVVFSTTLERVDTSRTTLERELTREVVERYRAEAAGDLTIEGPTLAATAFRLGLIDVVEVILCPVIIGGGLRVFPDTVRLDLRLTGETRFANGFVQVRYERGD